MADRSRGEPARDLMSVEAIRDRVVHEQVIYRDDALALLREIDRLGAERERSLVWIGSRCGIVTAVDNAGNGSDYAEGDSEPCVLCDDEACGARVEAWVSPTLRAERERLRAVERRHERMAAALATLIERGDVNLRCPHCGNAAVACVGEYESSDGSGLGLACDDCCAHGNEDGWCERIAIGREEPDRD